ncbi:Alpha-1-syntrophin [Amphibalanus amphitrite]|uniref:Alpha-1-syntrophin n=1 Tax=Amphibalanus amphitrite TaxID=1232801 RepID=A0A6A4WLP4_AMPAM|nr:Alpha-1-syntrophin [Amphibalanus amphitrite]
MLHTGTVKVSIGKAPPCPMKLTLNIDTITLQKEVDEETDTEVDSQTRVVELHKGGYSGLGISIKGGREHHLPILISRMMRGQPADQSGQLFIGDAILRVDGVSLLKASHDEAVNVLKNTGPVVKLVIKHYQVANQFLKRSSEYLTI